MTRTLERNAPGAARAHGRVVAAPAHVAGLVRLLALRHPILDSACTPCHDAEDTHRALDGLARDARAVLRGDGHRLREALDVRDVVRLGRVHVAGVCVRMRLSALCEAENGEMRRRTEIELQHGAVFAAGTALAVLCEDTADPLCNGRNTL